MSCSEREVNFTNSGRSPLLCAGALRFGFPSGRRGMPAVWQFSHCAEAADTDAHIKPTQMIVIR